MAEHDSRTGQTATAGASLRAEGVSEPRPLWTSMCERVAKAAAQGYFFPGADPEDVLQEARIGVAKALHDWSAEGGSSFAAFAFMCARRQVLTGLKTAQRAKHEVLTWATSLDAPPPGVAEGKASLGEVLPFKFGEDPCVIVIRMEAAIEALHRFSRLSAWERECVERVLLAGMDYESVGAAKKVDNAIQRARKKLADEAWQPVGTSRRVAVYVDRSVYRTERSAVREAAKVRQGRVIAITKRKLLGGRDRAPQGRPDSLGRRGQPVWRVDLEVAA